MDVTISPMIVIRVMMAASLMALLVWCPSTPLWRNLFVTVRKNCGKDACRLTAPHMGCEPEFFGGKVADQRKHLDGEHDRLVEHYEMPALIEGIQNVLDANGVLTVADYRRELAAARNDAQEHSASYGS